MNGVRVVDVQGLGQPAMVVSCDPRLLLLDEGLSHDDRVNILERFSRDLGGDPRSVPARKRDSMSAGFQVIDVPELGRPAQIVNTSGPRLLLLDEALPHEERMRIMTSLLDESDR